MQIVGVKGNKFFPIIRHFSSDFFDEAAKRKNIWFGCNFFAICATNIVCGCEKVPKKFARNKIIPTFVIEKR
jgi:hypothetical protein